MSLDPLIRRFSLISGILSIFGFVIGVVALGTNYWTYDTINQIDKNFMVNNNNESMNNRWNGLFMNCSRFDTIQCDRYFRPTTFFLCLFGLIVLLISGIFSIFEMIRTSDRRFFIPMLYFVSCVLMTAGLFDYGSMSRLNSHSSRAMITSIIFGYAVLPISAFVSGRYSAYDRYINKGQKYVSTATNGN